MAASAAPDGRAAALAVQCQRDLLRCAKAHPDLFPEQPFDPALFSAVSLANAFGSPWLTADRLRVANRTSLWIFALDWLVDHQARSYDAVRRITTDCLAVAAGADPVGNDHLTGFLAEIRDELATAAAGAELHAVWQDELNRMLVSMAREWEWKTAAAENSQSLPTLAAYLDNSDNFGSSFVNVGHWISTSDRAALRHLDRLRAASRKVQCVLRLLNDLATHERDLEWGDLNALMLGVDAGTVRDRITDLIDDCHDHLGRLAADCPDEAVYLDRQIAFSVGFYGAADYWGRL